MEPLAKGMPQVAFTHKSATSSCVNHAKGNQPLPFTRTLDLCFSSSRIIVWGSKPSVGHQILSCEQENVRRGRIESLNPKRGKQRRQCKQMVMLVSTFTYGQAISFREAKESHLSSWLLFHTICSFYT